MADLLVKLGIDWRLLLAQLVNFLILLFVLNKFLYKPLLKFLTARTERIEKSLEEAKKIETTLKETEKGREEKLAAARAEAAKIMEDAVTLAEKTKKELTEKAKDDVSRIVERGKIQISQEKDAMLKDAKKELADVILLVSEKVLGESAKNEVNRALVEKTIRSMKKIGVV